MRRTNAMCKTKQAYTLLHWVRADNMTHRVRPSGIIVLVMRLRVREVPCRHGNGNVEYNQQKPFEVVALLVLQEPTDRKD